MVTRLIFSLVLCVSVFVFLYRRHRKTSDRRYLCHRCRYNRLELCDRDDRPRSTNCDIFQPDEEWDFEENED